MHHDDWVPPPDRPRPPQPAPADVIEAHLEPDPFIVPPVLVKAELAVHPVLSVVWKLAYQRLIDAKTIVFIGYSLPVTDLASRILFRETLMNHVGRDVRIVNSARTGDDEERVKKAYRSLFADLPDANFDFAGASAWIEHQPGYAFIASEREGTV